MIQEEGKYYLYRHVRLDTNQVFYIGIGTVSKKNKHKRAKARLGRNNIWKNIVNKTNWTFEILLYSDDHTFIKEKEKEFISLYGFKYTGDKKGTLCNILPGGESPEVTEEFRKRISEGHKKRSVEEKMKTIEKIKLANTGRKQSPETIFKRNQSLKGKTRSEEHKLKIKKSLLTDECRKKLSAANKGKPRINNAFSMEELMSIKNKYIPKDRINDKRIKKISVYLLNGSYLMDFNSVSEASFYLNISDRIISRILKGKGIQSKSLTFRYAENKS